MGKIWLHNVVQPLAAVLGNRLKFYPGWETNCRSTGGFEDVRGIIWHHDASSTGSSEWNTLTYEYKTASDRPIGNFHVVRNGDVYFGAAGASNHAGKGGPVTTSRGVVPLNQGNLYLIGVEFSNNGVGESWSNAMVESGLTLFATLCRTKGLQASDVYGHGPRNLSWVGPSCPGRKIDPAGPSVFNGGANSPWDSSGIQNLRNEIAARMVPAPPSGGWTQPAHSLKTVPDGMEDDPSRQDVVWHYNTDPNDKSSTHYNYTYWLQQYFAEQAWWQGPVNGLYSLEFKNAVAFVQKEFKNWLPPKSPKPLTKIDGYWWQETAQKIDEWTRQQPWYNSI